MPNVLRYHRQARIIGANPADGQRNSHAFCCILHKALQLFQAAVRVALSSSMKILVIGSGAREHSLAWKLSRESDVTEVICAPGNPGIAEVARCVPANQGDPAELLAVANREAIDLTVVGPELPLSRGVVDLFTSQGRAILGPTQAAAALESSKSFAKDFMARHRVPTARFRVCDSAEEALAVIARDEFGFPLILKADGLAAGKGVVIAEDRAAARSAVGVMMVDRRFGAAGDRIARRG